MLDTVKIENAPKADAGPGFDDVIREIPFPKFEGPGIVPQKNIATIAEDQTAAIRHIAGTLSRMADWQIAQERSRSYMGDMTYTAILSVSNWMKWGVVLQSASILGACLYLIAR